MYKHLLLLALITIRTATAAAADNKALEDGLADALRLKPGTTERAGDSGKAIQAYMREGVVNKKPNERADYTDYYIVKKPATFMGHELVVIEEEYMSKYVGCCVNPGAGITVKVNGSPKNLEKFADKNKCSFADKVDVQGEMSRFGIRATFSKGRYASLSCRENDANR